MAKRKGIAGFNSCNQVRNAALAFQEQKLLALCQISRGFHGAINFSCCNMAVVELGLGVLKLVIRTRSYVLPSSKLSML